MTEITVTVNGRRRRELVEPRLLLSDFIRAHARPHRDARRLRARRLRRVHGAARRRRRPLVPRLRGPGGRRRARDRRGARGRRRADAVAGGLPRGARAPVRLLHARDPDGRGRPARPRTRRRAAPRSQSSFPAISAAAPATSRSSTRSPQPPPGDRREPRRLPARGLRAPPGARGVSGAPLRRAARARRGGSRAGSTLEPGRPPRGRARQPARDRAPLLGGAVGGRRASCRSRGACPRRSSTTASPTAARGSSSGTATSCPTGRSIPARSTAASDEPSLLLYTSGTTGRPKGVPRSHRADRAGAWSQALQHGYGWADRTLGVMPLYHTMGIHSLLAMHLVGGCFVPQRALGRRRGARADRGAADHVALPRADALPRSRPPPRPRAARRSRRCGRSATRAPR